MILIRHAETDTNAAGLIDFKMPGGRLTETGLAQAAALADRLAGRPIARLVSSPAYRTLETATPVAERLGLGVETFDGLREVDFGDLDGRSDTEAFGPVKEVLGAWASAEHDTALPGGESWNEVANRLRPVIDPLAAAERAGEGEVAIVGHAATFRILVDILAGHDATNSVGFLRNAGFLVLRPGDGDSWTVDQPDPGDITGPGSTDVRRIGSFPGNYGD